eukprot:11164054-Lingulodinium_polyedra.AAC.1
MILHPRAGYAPKGLPSELDPCVRREIQGVARQFCHARAYWHGEIWVVHGTDNSWGCPENVAFVTG